MSSPIQANRRNWDDRVAAHQCAPDDYDIAAFEKGQCTLKNPELGALGEVKGKTLLHLQCHFGMDSISWARRGARVTGVDFSPKAIARARELSAEVGVPVEFIESDVLALALDRCFDFVVTTYGILCWLCDMKRWADVVASHLKPGGTFFMIDEHPFTRLLEPVARSEEAVRMEVLGSYFDEGAMRFENDTSYAGNAKLTQRTSYEWNHSMADIMNALVGAGLEIRRVEEMREIFYPAWSHLVPTREGWWALPDGFPDMPLTLALTATK